MQQHAFYNKIGALAMLADLLLVSFNIPGNGFTSS